MNANDTWLDKIFETGTSVVNKYFDFGIASENKKAEIAKASAEESRLNALYEYSNTSKTDEILGLQMPSWVIPVGLAVLGGLILTKTVKVKI